MKTRKKCGTCGSEEVVRDAWAEWDFEKQEWVLADIFDDAWCNTCEGECSIEDEEVTADGEII